MNVRVIEAIDVVVSVKGPRLFGGFVVVKSDHLLVLGLRVPANEVSQIDPPHAHALELTVVWIDKRPHILGRDAVEIVDQILGFESHQVVLLAILAGHLDLVRMREHPHLIESLMRPPDDQRNLQLDRHCDRENRLARQAMPVDAPQAAQSRPRDLLDGLRVDREGHDVAIEFDPEVGQVSNADVGVVLLVVGHEQRVHPQDGLHRMDDEVGIAGTRDGNDAVVVSL